MGKGIGSRVSVTAGGGFNPLMQTRSGGGSRCGPSDSSMASFNQKRFPSDQNTTIKIKSFDGGFSKTLKAKHQRFKKK